MNAVEDIDSMMIDRSKLMADGAKYFELFEKHIPTGMSGNVLIMSIGNLDCLGKMMSLNKDAKYTVVENSRIIKCLSKLFDSELDIEGIETDSLDLYNIIKECDMKFDCIIMNPPYQRNLHLKILAEAIKHLKDDGKCVNLSPISTYQKCVKLEKEFPVAVTDIDVISQEDMNNCFDIGLWVDGGIVTVGKNATKDFSKFTYLVKHLALYKKLQKHSAKLKDKFTNSPADFSLRFFVGCNCDISHKFTMTPKTYADACTKKLNGHIAFINCTSDIERHNLYDVACGRFMKFCCYIDLDVRPWLGDAVNPRTGKKGYTGEWTDDDLYKFFNITPAEQKVIEETMEKYK